MLECKLAQGKQDVFVQDVKAAPEPQSVLFYDWQAQDLVKFCTRNHSFSILTNTTYNLAIGEFYVTLFTYHHLTTTLCLKMSEQENTPLWQVQCLYINV